MPTQTQRRRKRENRKLKRQEQAKEEKRFDAKSLFGNNDFTPYKAWYSGKLWRL